MSIEEEEEEEEDGQIVSLYDSRIERIRGGLAILSVLKTWSTASYIKSLIVP